MLNCAVQKGVGENYIGIELPFWKKGLKIVCPECKKKVSEPYKCECGAVLKPHVVFQGKI